MSDASIKARKTVSLPDAAAIASARRVIEVEGQAMLRLAGEIPEDLAHAVELISGCSGRLIVSGMGKSGHIARKIAATFASTGTPALFVHPAEASHGDLGMITSADICLLISNSGETTELGDLLAHAARFSIPVVAICGREDSTLMRAADVRLKLPDAPEACAIGMAPTTSTLLTLALGDALAMAIMERRGFAREQFSAFHPGGKLGARLAKVSQLMHPADESPIVGSDTPMSDTLIEMTAKGFGIACVTDADGRLVGVISDGDLRRAIDGLLERSAGDVATRHPITVTPDMLAAEAVALMQKGKVTTLVVTFQDRIPVGILRIHDCLRAGVV